MTSITPKEEYVNTIRGFVPDYLIANLPEGDNNKPYVSHFMGICLIVDISGFTRLSGSYCSEGKEGIDNLQLIVNEYMGQLVQIVYQYGGDVVKFAGDALVCIFAPQPENVHENTLLHCCVNAISCAWLLKDEATRNLTVHIGIGLGKLCFGVLGGCQNRWEFLVSGPCISQLGSCLDDAPSKNVVLTKDCYDYLRDNIDIARKPFSFGGTELETSNFLLTACVHVPPMRMILTVQRCLVGATINLDQIVQVLPTFVPTPVIQALGSGTLHFLPELRQVTTLFMKWDGYSEAHFTDLLSIQRHFYTCQEVLSTSGGFLRQFLVDDKGCVLIAMWGMPAATFADNILRALWTAVTLNSKLGRMKMGTSCGITTGNVYCGTVGNHIRQEYAAIGDVVNLAARLMSKAKGYILIDEDSHRRLPESVQIMLENVPEMKLKGKDHPIRPYKYSEIEAFPLSFIDIKYVEDSAPIRQVLKDSFGSIIQYLSSTHGPSQPKFFTFHKPPELKVRFLLIEGPVGAGSSHAITWLKHETQRSEFRVLSLELSKLDGTTDYSSVQKLFRLLIGEENYDDAGRQTFVINQLLREVYPHSSETVERVAYPAMRRVLGVTCPLAQKNRKQAPIEAAKSASKIPPKLLLQTVMDVFRYLITQQPLLITIEHVDFMDECSWKIIQSFTEIPTRVAFVMTKNQYGEKQKSMSSKKISEKIGGGVVKDEVKFLANSLTYHWVEPNCQLLLTTDSAISVTLHNYSFMEVRSFLTQSLRVFLSTSLPPGLDLLVFQLSGGNPFWVTEIIEFIRINGPRKFVTMIADDNNSNPNAEQTTRGMAAGMSFRGAANIAKNNSIRGAGGNKSTRVSMAISRGLSSHWSTQAIDLSSIASTDKLSFFVISRFAKQAIDEQSIARSASIIGVEFTEDILTAILPQIMWARLPIILNSLVQNKWLLSDYIESDGAVKKLYTFMHPMVHHVIYHLTPTGMRKQVHAVVAEYLEEHIAEHEQGFVINVAHHYSMAENQPLKTLEYCCKAANECVTSQLYGVEHCIAFLQLAKKYVKTATDMDTVIFIASKAIERAMADEAEINGYNNTWYRRLGRRLFPGPKVMPHNNMPIGISPQSLVDKLISLEADLQIEKAAELGFKDYTSSQSVCIAEWQVPFILAKQSKMWPTRNPNIRSSGLFAFTGSLVRQQSLLMPAAKDKDKDKDKNDSGPIMTPAPKSKSSNPADKYVV